jgi:hypothetical protein
LYYSTYNTHVKAKKKLYALLDDYAANARTKISITWNEDVETVWSSYGHRILPWETSNSSAASSIDDDVDDDADDADDDDADDDDDGIPEYCPGFTLL